MLFTGSLDYPFPNIIFVLKTKVSIGNRVFYQLVHSHAVWRTKSHAYLLITVTHRVIVCTNLHNVFPVNVIGFTVHILPVLLMHYLCSYRMW